MSNHEFKNDFEKFSYALGMSVASNLIKAGVQELDNSTFALAISDTLSGEYQKILPEDANKILEEFMAKSNEDSARKNLEEGLAFLAENKTKEGIIELPSGLQYEVITEGEGDIPTANNQVKCHYHGTLVNGTVFDSSVERGQPATFPVNGVIPGWVEALQLMSVGSKWRLFIPSELAYGPNGAGGVIGPNATLIFEVELLEIL